MTHLPSAGRYSRHAFNKENLREAEGDEMGERGAQTAVRRVHFVPLGFTY